MEKSSYRLAQKHCNFKELVFFKDKLKSGARCCRNFLRPEDSPLGKLGDMLDLFLVSTCPGEKTANL